MGDGPPERAGLGPLDVDVDPLVVAGGIGEQVDLLLGHLAPLAVAEVLADMLLEPVDPLDRGGHGPQARPGPGAHRNQVRRVRPALGVEQQGDQSAVEEQVEQRPGREVEER